MTSTSTSTSINLNDALLTKIKPEYRFYDTFLSEFEKWFFSVKYRTDTELSAFFNDRNNSGTFIVYDTKTTSSNITKGRQRTYEFDFPPYLVPTRRDESLTGPGGICNDQIKSYERLSSVYGYTIPEDNITFLQNIILHRGDNVGENKFTPYYWHEFNTFYCGVSNGSNLKNNKINARVDPNSGYWKLVPVLENFSTNILVDFLNSDLGKHFKYVCCTYIGNRGLDSKIRYTCEQANLYDGSVMCDNTMVEHCAKEENKYDISCGCMPDFIPKMFDSNDSSSSQLSDIFKPYKDGLDIYNKYKTDVNTKIPRKCIVGTCTAKSAYKIEDRNADCVNVCRSIATVNANKYSAVDMANIKLITNCNINTNNVSNTNTNITTDTVADIPPGIGNSSNQLDPLNPLKPKSDPEKTKDSETGLSKNTIIAISVGGAILAIFILVFLFVMYKTNE